MIWNRKILLTIVFLSFTAVGSAQELNLTLNEEIEEEYSSEGLNFESIENPEMVFPENIILSSFKFSKEEKDNRDINITYGYSKSNYPDLSRELIFLFKGDRLSFQGSVPREGPLRFSVEEPGKYYLVELSDRNSWNFYISEGRCQILLSPKSSDLKVDTCDSVRAESLKILQNITLASLILPVALVTFIALSVYVLTPRMLEKIILRKNSEVMRKTAEFSDTISKNTMLKRLITADEEALNGNYIEAYRIIREIEDTLEN